MFELYFAISFPYKLYFFEFLPTVQEFGIAAALYYHQQSSVTQNLQLFFHTKFSIRWPRDIKKNSSSFSFLTHRCIFLSLITARFFLQCQGNLGRKNIAFLVAYNRPFPLLNFLLKWAKITIYCAPKYQQINECKYLGGDQPKCNKIIPSNNKLQKKSQ